jgi:tryptophan halogenase
MRLSDSFGIVCKELQVLNLRNPSPQRIVVLGGGTAGWFAAIALRRMFSPSVEIKVIESSKIGIVGVGEGGLLNFIGALHHNNIDINEFVRETGATWKWGFSYEGWRTGKEDDRFFHLFASQETPVSRWQERGSWPYLCAMVSQQTELDSYIEASRLIKNNATQAQATALLDTKNAGIVPSFHFDSYKLAGYLKKVALSRGVQHLDAVVDEVVFDEKGFARELRTADERIALDFLIDASGLSRKVIGKKGMESEWVSFKDYLLMDCAIPFYMPHPQPNPMLVTRAVTMNAGWMWQIPLVDRVGAGYVFSSKHLSEEEAVKEVEQRLGYAIEPHKTLRFDPGCFRKVWQNNVMALGLSSGFVEPLEATSIGQMLEQLHSFERVVTSSQGVVSDSAIREFNEANFTSWACIRDFLRMHYDCGRNDTPLWQAVAKSPYPESYRALREVWQERMPRMVDVENYAIHGWRGIFHPINWTLVAAPLGVLPPEAGEMELRRLTPQKYAEAQRYAAEVKN